jgi:hypothetical protein
MIQLMSIDSALLTSLGDVFLNLSAGWFGAAVIFPGTGSRSPHANILFVVMNLVSGIAALAIGYKLRILGV